MDRLQAGAWFANRSKAEGRLPPLPTPLPKSAQKCPEVPKSGALVPEKLLSQKRPLAADDALPKGGMPPPPVPDRLKRSKTHQSPSPHAQPQLPLPRRQQIHQQQDQLLLSPQQLLLSAQQLLLSLSPQQQQLLSPQQQQLLSPQQPLTQTQLQSQLQSLMQIQQQQLMQQFQQLQEPQEQQQLQLSVPPTGPTLPKGAQFANSGTGVNYPTKKYKAMLCKWF